MHRALAWCKHGHINQRIKFASYRFQGIAGRSNIERSTSNFEWEKIKKQTYDLKDMPLEFSMKIMKIVEQLPDTKSGNNVWANC
jgi:hypothetical protein